MHRQSHQPRHWHQRPGVGNKRHRHQWARDQAAAHIVWELAILLRHQMAAVEVYCLLNESVVTVAGGLLAMRVAVSVLWRVLSDERMHRLRSHQVV